MSPEPDGTRPRRVLIVAYYFPPIGGIGSIRLTRFAEMLPEHGWEPTVLAPRDTPHPPDPHLSFPERRVARSRSIELSRAGRTVLRADAAGGATGSAAGASSHERLRRAAHRFLFYPDGQIGWYPGAVLAGLRLVRSEPFDAIYSSSNPMTAHLVARTISRRSGLPWVAEYRDPWRDRLPHDHPYRRHAARLEQRVADEATRVVMPTPTWAEHYGRLWGTDVAVLPNGFDVALRATRPAGRPTLTYLGSYYPGLQSLTALWAVISRMARQNRVDTPRIRFVGTLPEALRSELEGFGIEDLVEATGFVPHDEAMRLMADSSMLVASGLPAGDPATSGWVPAKLFDYLASDLPILFLSDPDTDAARLLDEPGCYVVRPSDEAGVAAALQAGLSGGAVDRDVGRFSRSQRTAALAAILERARAARAGSRG